MNDDRFKPDEKAKKEMWSDWHIKSDCKGNLSICSNCSSETVIELMKLHLDAPTVKRLKIKSFYNRYKINKN